MMVAGKKIVELERHEKDTLIGAINILSGLSEALGNDDFWDFEDLANTLYDIAHENKFEQDFEQ